MFKDRKPGLWLTVGAAVLALLGAAAYLVSYLVTRDPVTGEFDRVFNGLTPALAVGGALIALLGEAFRLRFTPLIAAILYAAALANHLVETAYPLADILTKVPFFGGNAALAITFSVIFGAVAIVNIVASYMEHNANKQ